MAHCINFRAVCWLACLAASALLAPLVLAAAQPVSVVVDSDASAHVEGAARKDRLAPEDKPVFDEKTGAPLNEAAREILEHGEADRQAAREPPSAASGEEDVLLSVPEEAVAEGTWKFVFVELTSPRGGQKRVVVSYAGVGYHAVNYDMLMQGLRPRGIAGRVLGGGRLVKDSGKRVLSVYGYSKTYGRCRGCNEEVAGILRRHYPDWTVSWSDKGY